MSGVLHVCPNNLSRSPVAEAVMRDQLRRGLGVDHDVVPVASAGLAVRAGEALEPWAVAELGRRALTLPHFATQAVSRSLVSDADLILTATRTERDEVAALLPSALFRTFTWCEIAALLTGVEPAQVPGATANGRTRALAEIATRRRRILTPLPGEALDVTPARGRHPWRHRRQARSIEEALAVVVRLVVPPVGLAATAESNYVPVLLEDMPDYGESVLDLDDASLVSGFDETPPVGLPRVPEPEAPAVPQSLIEASGGMVGGWPGAVARRGGPVTPEEAARTAADIDAVLAQARRRRF